MDQRRRSAPDLLPCHSNRPNIVRAHESPTSSPKRPFVMQKWKSAWGLVSHHLTPLPFPQVRVFPERIQSSKWEIYTTSLLTSPSTNTIGTNGISRRVPSACHGQHLSTTCNKWLTTQGVGPWSWQLQAPEAQPSRVTGSACPRSLKLGGSCRVYRSSTQPTCTKWISTRKRPREVSWALFLTRRLSNYWA